MIEVKDSTVGSILAAISQTLEDTTVFVLLSKLLKMNAFVHLGQFLSEPTKADLDSLRVSQIFPSDFSKFCFFS